MQNYQGLSAKKALAQQKNYGQNKIKRINKTHPVKIFLSQFTSPLILLLLFSAVILVIIGYLPNQTPDYMDAILIVVIVFLSGFSGFIQEYKAEKSIEALEKMSVPTVQVLRDNKLVELAVKDVTVGDLVLIEAGDVIPADGEILESFNLKIDESVLTGESDSVDKKIGETVFKNTSVYIGNAKIKITSIGMQTKIGKIADKLQEIKNEKSSFEEEIERFSQKIFWATGVIIVIIFIGNILKYDLYISLLSAVSLAVAAIPEGLPAVVVLSLALGAKIMFRNKALIRKLSVVESVGAVDVICSDKTGTITKNEMSVIKFYLHNKIINVGRGSLCETERKKLYPLLECAMLCNNTKVEGVPRGKRKYIGEQTEIGLTKIGEYFGLFNEELSKEYIKIDEIPFSSERKMMSVVMQLKKYTVDKKIIFAKGAPEVLLEKCNRILLNGQIKKLSLADRKGILEQNRDFASNAYRVLGFAFRRVRGLNEPIEKNLVWLGLSAMIDPPHTEISKTLEQCYSAGIRVIMITGDNPITAQAIADSVGLDTAGVLEGKDVDSLSLREIRRQLDSGINIFARTTPMHKLKILKILQKTSRVAMTGDGVNDSLAIKQADVGIAMGVKGTSVSKESSDIILLDDNFSTIVKAIKEGRRVFDNIRKFINYLLVSNLAEVFVLFLSALFLTLDKPILLPVQILWINLLTDGLPALALGVDPARADIMHDKPRRKNEPLINKRLAWLIVLIGIAKTILLLVTFLVVLPFGEDLARTTLFTGFILYEFVRIASIRYQEKLSWFSNPWLLMALLVSMILQVIIIYSPLQSMFHTIPMDWPEWGILLAGTGLGFLSAIAITRFVVNNKFFAE